MQDLHLPDIYIDDAIKVKIKTSKYNKKLKTAQTHLEMMIAEDIKPYMPMVTGNFIQRTQAYNGALLGTGVVMIAPAPFGRYLYEGKVMVDSVTGKGARPIKLKTGEVIYRHRAGSTLVATNRPLKYSRAGATDHWYERAKADNWDRWMDVIENDVGGKISGR